MAELRPSKEELTAKANEEEDKKQATLTLTTTRSLTRFLTSTLTLTLTTNLIQTTGHDQFWAEKFPKDGIVYV